MNKRLVPRRPLSASLGQLNEVGLPSAVILSDEGTVDLPSRKASALPNGIVSTGSAVTQLLSRGTDSSYDSALKSGKIDHLSSSAPGSPPDLYASVYVVLEILGGIRQCSDPKKAIRMKRGCRIHESRTF